MQNTGFSFSIWNPQRKEHQEEKFNKSTETLCCANKSHICDFRVAHRCNLQSKFSVMVFTNGATIKTDVFSSRKSNWSTSPKCINQFSFHLSHFILFFESTHDIVNSHIQTDWIGTCRSFICFKNSLLTACLTMRLSAFEPDASTQKWKLIKTKNPLIESQCETRNKIHNKQVKSRFIVCVSRFLLFQGARWWWQAMIARIGHLGLWDFWTSHGFNPVAKNRILKIDNTFLDILSHSDSTSTG